MPPPPQPARRRTGRAAGRAARWPAAAGAAGPRAPPPGRAGARRGIRAAGAGAGAGGRGWGRERLQTLETNLDDLSPEVAAFVLDELLEAGAKDAWIVQGIMKKGRPAMILHVLCAEADGEDLADLIFRETGSLGVRMAACDRISLRRRLVAVDTAWGPVTVKVAEQGGATTNVKPEYEECARIVRAGGEGRRKRARARRLTRAPAAAGEAARGPAEGGDGAGAARGPTGGVVRRRRQSLCVGLRAGRAGCGDLRRIRPRAGPGGSQGPFATVKVLNSENSKCVRMRPPPAPWTPVAGPPLGSPSAS